MTVYTLQVADKIHRATVRCSLPPQNVKSYGMFDIALVYDTVGIYCGNFRYMEKTYELPDGNIITVGAERFRCLH